MFQLLRSAAPVLAVLLVTATVTAGEPREVGVDRPGADFRDFDVDNGADACQSRCEDDERCRAWTFVGPEAPQGSGHCWLKDSIPEPRPMANAVSGVVGLRLPVEGWDEPSAIVRDVAYADLVVRVGDIDNLGFGWPRDFDPYSGKSTPSHPYPWQPEPDDPPATDRIMLGSGYDGDPPRGQDGYTGATSRPANEPRELRIELPDNHPQLESVMVQLFVDDLQAPAWGGHYRVEIDGQRMANMETAINALEQTGPIGKLVSLPLLPAYHELLNDDVLEILIDDPSTGAGDGYAIDFARLLVNPRQLPHAVTISGRVTDAATGSPLDGALVSSALAEQQTGTDGRYALSGIPAGLAVVRAARDGYSERARTADLVSGQQGRIDFALEKATAHSDNLDRALEQQGRARLSGIYFDLDSARLKGESTATLQQVLTLMQRHPGRRYRIEGHTDNQGRSGYNRKLSGRRAESVVRWLVDHGVDRARLEAVGYGERRPVADNATAAGRALNRRVEISVRDDAQRPD